MAGLLKKAFPLCTIYFLGRTYTKDVVALSAHVDGFINYDEVEKLPADERVQFLKTFHADVFVHVFPVQAIAHLAKKAHIPLRVGTTNRFYHWLSCNSLVRLSRRNSQLHEVQLNFKLLQFLDINLHVPLAEVPDYYGFSKTPTLDPEFFKLINKQKFNLILHPKSKGSAREWGLDNFEKLVQMLPSHAYQIFVSGTAEDGAGMTGFLKNERIINLCGKLSLQQFIAFINASDGLVAASTGPLHLAAALNKRAIGLFVPMRPIHPGRWAPLGKKASVLVENKPECSDCRRGGSCHCIRAIQASAVVKELEKDVATENRHDIL